jgi:hypothetical protein
MRKKTETPFPSDLVFLSAAQVAEMLGTSVTYVYERRAQLGGFRIAGGGAVRFRLETLRRRLAVMEHEQMAHEEAPKKIKRIVLNPRHNVFA